MPTGDAAVYLLAHDVTAQPMYACTSDCSPKPFVVMIDSRSVGADQPIIAFAVAPRAAAIMTRFAPADDPSMTKREESAPNLVAFPLAYAIAASTSLAS